MTTPTKDRDAVLAEMAARRAALDAFDAAALVDVSAHKQRIADEERTVQRLAHRIADEERQLRDARARIAVDRDAIRAQLGCFVAAGAQSAAVATLHGVPSSWVEPRADDLGGDGEEDGARDEGGNAAGEGDGDSWVAPEPVGPATADLYAVATNEQESS